MTLLKLIKDELKIDFSNTVVERESSSERSNPFELTAKDFLRFAKLDFKTNDEKGNINALTNAKRAIDCQIDTAFSIFGISFDKIPVEAEVIINLTDLHTSNFPKKLKLIKALDFAPSNLISKTRTLRNKLEHYYTKPQRVEVNEAIELAELFILTIENRIKMIPIQFFISDKKNYITLWEYENYIEILYDTESKLVSMYLYKNKVLIEQIIFNQFNEVLYGLIPLFNNLDEEIELVDSLKIFLKIIKHPIPEKNVKIILHN
jgi:hypothetical protein